MQPSNPIDRQRTFPNQNLGTILTIGFGGSIFLHLCLIAAITYWWKPPALIDEPLEITLVEPIPNEETSPTPAPVKPPPKQVSTPKPIAIKPIPIPTISPAILLAIQPAQIIAKPKPIAIESTRKPIPPKPVSKPKQIIPKPIVNPPFPADKFRPINSRLAEPPGEKITPSTFNPTPNIPIAPSNLSPPLTKTFTEPNQPQDLPKVVKNPSAGGNNDDRLSKDIRSTEGILAGNGDRSVGGASLQENRSSSSGRKQSNSIPKTGLNGDKSNIPATASNSDSGAGNGRLECVQNCQIPKLQDLQDSDGGKDRLRIRVVIDANGVLISAEIAKSSGNLQIDSVILDGIKRMQFNPTGQMIKGIIKANILL